MGENSKKSIEPEKPKKSRRMTVLKVCSNRDLMYYARCKSLFIHATVWIALSKASDVISNCMVVLLFLLILEHCLCTQALGKVLGAVGTMALATGGAPDVALATRRGVRTTKAAVQVVATVDKTNRLVATAVTGATLACAIGKILFDTLMRGVGSKATQDKIAEVFPGSLKNKDLVVRVKRALRKYDFGSDSLLVTSLDPDEVNRVLEKDFGYAFKEDYNMGGLAGFPFGGVSSRIDQNTTAALGRRRRRFFG